GWRRARRTRGGLAGARGVDGLLGRGQLPARAQAAPAPALLRGQGRAAARGRRAMSDENFLSRWSRRKHAAAAGVRSEDAAPATAPVPPGAAGATPASAVSAEPAPPAELPPVASLSIESD